MGFAVVANVSLATRVVAFMLTTVLVSVGLVMVLVIVLVGLFARVVSFTMSTVVVILLAFASLVTTVVAPVLTAMVTVRKICTRSRLYRHGSREGGESAGNKHE
jgi:hypothetical protein